MRTSHQPSLLSHLEWPLQQYRGSCSRRCSFPNSHRPSGTAAKGNLREKISRWREQREQIREIERQTERHWLYGRMEKLIHFSLSCLLFLNFSEGLREKIVIERHENHIQTLMKSSKRQDTESSLVKWTWPASFSVRAFPTWQKKLSFCPQKIGGTDREPTPDLCE